jgi:hypothetical protein
MPVAPVPAAPSQGADPKRMMIDEMIGRLKPVNTFASIGDVVGFGRNFIRKRLLEKFADNPGIMYRIGDDYRIPRATAEEFIRELYEY